MRRSLTVALALALCACQPTQPYHQPGGATLAPSPSTSPAPASSTWNGAAPYINSLGEPTYTRPSRGYNAFLREVRDWRPSAQSPGGDR